MKFLFDFFPVVLFFIAYKVQGIFVAPAIAIVASFIQVGFYWFKHHKFENTHLVTLTLIVIFGGLTLAFHNETFIKWKPSIINWLFGIVFLGSQFLGKKCIVERMMGNSISLPAFIWPRLNLAWAMFFIALGFANLYVMSNFDTNTWVNFKVFGMMGLTLAFVLGQGFYLAHYIQEEPAKEEVREDSE
jgi:intracellular septation protein